MRRILAVVVLALSALVGLPAGAQAGGPTSILVGKAGVGAGALYYSDAAYDALVRLLPEGETTGEPMPPGYQGDDFTLTWMIHDVEPWRWDRLHVAADGAAWVSTTLTSDAMPQWQALGPAERLTGLLDRVVEKGGGPAVVSVPAEPLSEPPAEPAAQAAPPDDASSWVALSGWRWVVPGALLGLVVGAVAARRRGDKEPRRVLINAES